ncbi:MAG: EamA family transporter [Bryobacteraceae bacterium]
MSLAAATATAMSVEAAQRRRSVLMVFGCTLFGAAAQVLIKTGANRLEQTDPLAMITNPALVAGYSLYGLSTILLVLALRRGQLSLLYPVISLTYVWVTVLSVWIFNESMNLFKLIGVGVIVLGVAVLGRDGRR